MNKKRVGVLICFLFIIIVLMSFVSAGFFSNIWGKITGKVIVDTTQRVSFWSGKVNQHTENGVWMTDDDGSSGANLGDTEAERIEYCKKFYGEGITASPEYGLETIDFCSGGNYDCSYTSTKTTYECLGGETVSVCVDSDGGQIGDNVGTVTYGDQSYTDICEEAYSVLEWYCDTGGLPNDVSIYCVNGCEEGECVVEEPFAECVDSDVNGFYLDGKSYYVKGYADLDGYKSWDVCEDETFLKETYCFDDGINDIVYECPNGCFDGACVEEVNTTNQTCEDSDGGDNIYKKGYRINHNEDYQSYGIIEWDYCIQNPDMYDESNIISDGEKMVSYCEGEGCYIIEFHCREEVLSDAHQGFPCPNGCIDGACVKEGIQKSYCETLDNPNSIRCKLYETEKINQKILGKDYLFYLHNHDGREIGFTVNGYESGDMEGGESDVVGGLEVYIKEVDPLYDFAIIVLSIYKEPIIIEDPEDCTSGCYIESDKICYPIGYRKEGLYCGLDKIFISQLEEAKFCENSFECKSNVCVGEECLSQTFIQKIIAFFTRLFGEEAIPKSSCNLEGDCVLYEKDIVKTTIDGKDYEVFVVSMDSTSVELSVNEELITLKSGEAYSLGEEIVGVQKTDVVSNHVYFALRSMSPEIVDGGGIETPYSKMTWIIKCNGVETACGSLQESECRRACNKGGEALINKIRQE